MSLPLRIKIETLVAGYIEDLAAGTDLEDLTIVPGHSASEPALPYLVVYCGQCPRHPEMPAEAMIHNATVVLHLKTNATDEARSLADARVEALRQIVLEPLDNAFIFSDSNKPCGALLAFLQKPAVGDDPRPVAATPFHAYDVTLLDDSSFSEEGAWHDQLTLEIVCQPMDSH